MSTKLKNVFESWLYLILSIVVAGIMVGIAYLLMPMLQENLEKEWIETFVTYIKYGAFIAVFLQLINSIVMAFSVVGLKRRTWKIFLFLNIVCALILFALFLVLNSFEIDIISVLIPFIMFQLMFVLTYIISTLFLPESYKFANPLCEYIFK